MFECRAETPVIHSPAQAQSAVPSTHTTWAGLSSGHRILICAAANFLLHPPAVWSITSRRLCALPGNTITRDKVLPRRPSCHIHCMTRVHWFLLRALLPTSSSLPFPSPKPELALLRKQCGFMWAWLTCSKALHRHGQTEQCCNPSLKLWLYLHSTNIPSAQPRLTLPGRFAHTCQMWQLLQGKL